MAIHEKIDYPEREVKSGATQTQFSGNLEIQTAFDIVLKKIFNISSTSVLHSIRWRRLASCGDCKEIIRLVIKLGRIDKKILSSS